jgi:hypothetical protein
MHGAKPAMKFFSPHTEGNRHNVARYIIIILIFDAKMGSLLLFFAAGD